jgi:ABC-type polysaccharide/polyol phosphate transport system ATPase subunit
MLARLGFAVLTAWQPDVLVLDEFLAVGDLHFVKKCRDWMEHARAQGATLLLVSHDPEAVRQNCRRCIWLEGGRLRADGRPDEVLDLYAESGEAAVDLDPGSATVSA